MVLVVRYEGSGGRVQAKRVPLPCAATTAATAKPWWRADLAKDALRDPYARKQAANEAFVRGRRSGELADALRGQAELVELRLTIDAASAPLGFVASLPALTRVVFEDMNVSKDVVAPLKACKPLQEVAFDNCLSSLSETFDHGLPARVRVRSFTRRFQ